MKTILVCTAYSVHREPNNLTEINARFYMQDKLLTTEERAEALKRLELFLADEITIEKEETE